MATRNLVPRSGSEGSVGTNSKPWGSMIANIGHFNSIISASGDIVAFGDISSSISSTGSFGKLEIAGNSNFTGDVTIGGNINIGDADTDSLVISADLSSSLIPNDDSTYDLGTGAKNWRRGYVEKLEVTNITASGNIDFNGDLDVDGATTLDQVTINTTDGEFKVEGSNQVNIDSNIDIDNATTAIDTTTSTIITSPIINLVGAVTASENISSSATITALQYGGNVSGSATSTGSFGRIFAAGDIYATGEVSADSFVSRDGSETISFQDDVAFGADDSITSIQNITATGNISSSVQSTGSFGRLHLAAATVVPDGNGNITLGAKLILGDTHYGVMGGVNSIETNGGELKIGTFSSHAVRLKTANTERLTILSGGNVGVGVTDPDAKLEVAGTTHFQGVATFDDNVVVQGKLTAQEIHTEIESASVIFTSGSTLFGNTSDDLHRFTGSVNVTENVSLQSDIIISGNITASNNISASGDILADGRIFEKGTSVIDHATAMSIVFGG